MFRLALLLLLVFPAAASAGTARVVPYAEPPGIDPFSSCARYMVCPPDMAVFDAAPGEANRVTITEAWGGSSYRFLVRDEGAPLQAGAGCEQVGPNAVACTAQAIGPLRLGDGDDRLTAMRGEAWGGAGADVLTVRFARMEGGGDDDVLTGAFGKGGGGDDRLVVSAGYGGPGEDLMRCPREAWCALDGGPGDDQMTGSDQIDRLFGRGGDDVVRGRREFDTIEGNRGDDLLFGGPHGDHLRGGLGNDRVVSRESRFSGAFLDRVDCGPGRSDRAIADWRDDPVRCEVVQRAAP